MKLDDATIDARLTDRPGWIRTADASPVLQRAFACGDFLRSMTFVNAIAEAAEAANHHPDMLVQYATVTISLSTHDAGGITDKDFQLAATIDTLHAG
jgi:4a-hydroxytetrahydrobiopterin dehydratase